MMSYVQLPGVHKSPLTIAASGSVSSIADVGNGVYFGMYVPVMNGTPNLTFEASHDGTDFADLMQDDGTTASLTVVGQDGAVAIGSDQLEMFKGWRFLRATASVVQSAERKIWITWKE